MTVYISSVWGVNNIDIFSKVARGNLTYNLAKLIWEINTRGILD